MIFMQRSCKFCSSLFIKFLDNIKYLSISCYFDLGLYIVFCFSFCFVFVYLL